MSAKKLLKPIKSMLHGLVGEETGNAIFETNFPRMSKEEAKEEQEKDRVIQILECLRDTPNRLTLKMIKDFKKITGMRLNKPKKKKNVKFGKRKR